MICLCLCGRFGVLAVAVHVPRLALALLGLVLLLELVQLADQIVELYGIDSVKRLLVCSRLYLFLVG